MITLLCVLICEILGKVWADETEDPKGSKVI
jgi:hypothetical protein